MKYPEHEIEFNEKSKFYNEYGKQTQNILGNNIPEKKQKNKKISAFFISAIILVVTVIGTACGKSNTDNNSSTQKTNNNNEQVYDISIKDILVTSDYIFTVNELHDTYGSECIVTLFDVDKDGIYELIAKTGTCDADSKYEFYKLSRNSLDLIGTLEALNSGLLEADGSLIYQKCYMGYESVFSIELDDNEVVHEELYSDGPVDEYSVPGNPIEFIALSELLGEDVTQKEKNYLCNPETDVSFSNDKYYQTEIVTEDFWNLYSDYYLTISKGIELHNSSRDYSYHGDGSLIDSGLIELYVYPDGYDSWYRIHWGWRLADGTDWNNPVIEYEVATVYKIWNDGSFPYNLPDDQINEFLYDLDSIYESRCN